MALSLVSSQVFAIQQTQKKTVSVERSEVAPAFQQVTTQEQVSSAGTTLTLPIKKQKSFTERVIAFMNKHPYVSTAVAIAATVASCYGIQYVLDTREANNRGDEEIKNRQNQGVLSPVVGSENAKAADPLTTRIEGNFAHQEAKLKSIEEHITEEHINNSAKIQKDMMAVFNDIQAAEKTVPVTYDSATGKFMTRDTKTPVEVEQNKRRVVRNRETNSLSLLSVVLPESYKQQLEKEFEDVTETYSNTQPSGAQASSQPELSVPLVDPTGVQTHVTELIPGTGATGQSEAKSQAPLSTEPLAVTTIEVLNPANDVNSADKFVKVVHENGKFWTRDSGTKVEVQQGERIVVKFTNSGNLSLCPKSQLENRLKNGYENATSSYVTSMEKVD